MKRMAAGVFKAKCLAVMDQVASQNEGIVITKRGKPVAKLVPINTDSSDDIFGFMKSKGRTKGNIVAPAMSLKEWGSLG